MIHSIECAYLLNSEVSGVDFEHADMEKGSLYELLRREAGIVFDYITEQFKAILCPEREAELLGVKRDEPGPLHPPGHLRGGPRPHRIRRYPQPQRPLLRDHPLAAASHAGGAHRPTDK